MGVIEDRYGIFKGTNLSGVDLTTTTNISGQVLKIPTRIVVGSIRINTSSTASSYITSTWAQRVIIKPSSDNNQNICVGLSGVSVTSGSIITGQGIIVAGAGTNLDGTPGDT